MRLWQQRAESVNFSRCRDVGAHQRRRRIKIIILLWANNSQSVSERAERWTELLFFLPPQRSYGDKPDFANIYLHIEIWETENHTTPHSSWVSSQIHFCFFFKRTKIMHVEVCRSSNGHISSWISNTVAAQRCAQASLGPCTSLYPSSLHRQKLQMRWAKAIPVNSLFLHEKLVSTPALPGACRDEAEKTSLDASHSPAAERLPLSRSLPLRRPAFSKVSFTEVWTNRLLGHLWLLLYVFPSKQMAPLSLLEEELCFCFISLAPTFSQGEKWWPRVMLKYTKPSTNTDVHDCSWYTVSQKIHSCVSASHHMWCDGISRSPG